MTDGSKTEHIAISTLTKMGEKLKGHRIGFEGCCAAALLFACADDVGTLRPIEPGVQDGPCYGNDTCNDGLVCADDICIVPQPFDGGMANADAGSLEVDAGPLDTGVKQRQTGSVFGVVALKDKPDLAGSEVEIAGLIGHTNQDGEYRIDDVPVGSHVLTVHHGPAPTLGTVEGSVEFFDGRQDRGGVNVVLQAAPDIFIPEKEVGVVVFANQDTEVRTLELGRFSPFARIATTDSSGTYTMADVPSASYFGASPTREQPAGTYAIAASTSEFDGVAPDEPDADLRLTSLTIRAHGRGQFVLSDRVGWQESINVPSPPGVGRAPVLILYRGNTVSAGIPREHPSIDFSTGQIVPAQDTSTDLTLIDLNPSQSPRTLRFEGIGIQILNDDNLQSVPNAPISGYRSGIELTIGDDVHDPLQWHQIFKTVFAVQTAEGDYVKVKVHGIGIGSAASASLLYYHQPGGTPAFDH